MEEIVRYSSTLLGILKPQIRTTEDHCGEHRLLACSFRQPAEKPLRTFDSTWCCKSLKRRRQAADDNRLAACAPPECAIRARERATLQARARGRPPRVSERGATRCHLFPWPPRHLVRGIRHRCLPAKDHKAWCRPKYFRRTTSQSSWRGPDCCICACHCGRRGAGSDNDGLVPRGQWRRDAR